MSKKDILISREELVRRLEEEYNQAAPYTGEYHSGRADLINEFLCNPPIKWEEHPNWKRLHSHDSNISMRIEQ